MEYQLLYRGLNQPKNRNRIGRWWTTSPYYALTYKGGENGEMFVAAVAPSDLEKLAQDASIDSDIYGEFYFFGDVDPPSARKVTPEEIKELEARATFTQGEIGGLLMRPPENFAEVGKKIFGKTFNSGA